MLRRQCIAAMAGAVLFAGALSPAHADKALEEPFPVKGKVTVVDFGAEWCESCPEMIKLMEEMQKEYGDRAAFINIDVDKYQGIEDKYLIEQMPSQMFFDASGEPIWIHKGAIDAETLRERVDILLAGPQK